MHLAEVRIDLSAISHNLAWIKKRTQTSTMAMIKADAYGHDAVQVARHLEKEGVSNFGVATLAEAKQLRQAGTKGRILVLQPFHRLEPLAFETYQLEWLFQSPQDIAFAEQMNAPFHLMMDSGMGREGLQPQNFAEIWQQLKSKQILPTAICTHFFASDVDQGLSAKAQWQHFKSALKQANVGEEIPIHAANSGAIVNLPESYGKMVRPGILLYGQYHGSGEVNQRPAMSVWAQIHSTKDLPGGHAIGYGPIFRTSRPTKVGLLSLGYADGLLRRAPHSRFVTWQNQKIAVIGRISMDQIVLDLNHAKIEEGDWVRVIGDEEIIEEAKTLDTISYERCCQWGMRLPKTFGAQS